VGDFFSPHMLGQLQLFGGAERRVQYLLQVPPLGIVVWEDNICDKFEMPT
jgi:hypothetical protein